MSVEQSFKGTARQLLYLSRHITLPPAQARDTGFQHPIRGLTYFATPLAAAPARTCVAGHCKAAKMVDGSRRLFADSRLVLRDSPRQTVGEVFI
jgi:hypothetical protein